MKWLDEVAENGAALVPSNAQDDDYSAILPTSLAAEEWSNIYISAHTRNGNRTKNRISIGLFQQSSSALFRMCGAEMLTHWL